MFDVSYENFSLSIHLASHLASHLINYTKNNLLNLNEIKAANTKIESQMFSLGFFFLNSAKQGGEGALSFASCFFSKCRHPTNCLSQQSNIEINPLFLTGANRLYKHSQIK